MGKKSKHRTKTPAEISYNVSCVRSTGSKIEQVMERALQQADLAFEKHSPIVGRPDFVFWEARVAEGGFTEAIRNGEIEEFLRM